MTFSRMAFMLAVFDGMAAAFAVAALVALRGRPWRLSAVDVVLGAGTALAFGLVQAVMFVETGYGKLHVAYLVITVGLPVFVVAAAGMILLVRSLAVQVAPGRLAPALAGLLLLFAPLGFYATHIEPGRLGVDRVEFDTGAGTDITPVRVGVLADLQTNRITDHERDAVARLMVEEPDIVLIPGDVFQAPEAELERWLPELWALLSELDAPFGTFAVQGDAEGIERLRRIAEGSDIQVLDNEVTSVTVRDRTVHLGGLRLEWHKPEAAAAIAQLDSTGDDDDLRLLVAHRPDVVRALPGDQIDLVVAGHTHGGQIQIPFVGPLITFSDLPRSVAAGGLHEVDGNAIYVGTGVGLVRSHAPQVRFGVPPEVAVVTIR